MTELRVRRDDLAACALVEGEARDDDLADGEARLLVERFALSTNNITYGLLGDDVGYWQLFPAGDGWGRIPAWGHARVVASRAPGAAGGQRVFGLVPMAGYVTVRPEAQAGGFVDAAPHRAGLARLYNRYLPIGAEEDEAALLMRPLFATSVLLDLLLAEAGFEGAQTVVLTSASSKTAYGLAHLLRERAVETVGLTSGGRRGWVEGLGLYDAVLGYGDAGDLRAPDGAVLVDFAGDGALVRAVHARLGDALRRSIRVGFTHQQAAAGAEPLPGPAPEFFFAPDEMARRGRDLGERYAASWQGFAPVAARTMVIQRVTGGEAVARAYLDLLRGRADPAVGYVASLA